MKRRETETIATLQSTAHPAYSVHIEAGNGIDIRPLCQANKSDIGWTDGYKIQQRPFSDATCEECKKAFCEINELKYAVVRVLFDGMVGTKGPPNSRVVAEWDSTRRQVVVRLTRKDGDVPASEASATIKMMAGLLEAAGYACTRSRTRVRVSMSAPKPLPAPDTVCLRPPREFNPLPTSLRPLGRR